METGCIIDGSHMSSFDFTTAVIDYAISQGFEIDLDTYHKDIEDMRNGDVDDDWVIDVLDSLDWTYEDALDYIQFIMPIDYIYVVRDNSLFREYAND